MTSPATSSTITHRHVAANGLRLHIAECGPSDGPVVVLCHGFPECWYSWRHQLRALGAAGYHAIAPDLRGYGTSDMPSEVGAYTVFHHVGDLVGVLDAVGASSAAVVGHDWGGPVAWHAALLRPDRFAAVASLSTHWSGVPAFDPARPPLSAMREAMGDAFLYILYFQEPGAAERELDADVRRSLGSTLYGLSASVPPDQWRFFNPDATCFSDCVRELPGPLPWLSQSDLDTFVESFSHHGTFFGGLNFYRCIDRNAELMAAFVGRRIEQPALFIGADRDCIFGQTPEAVAATRAHIPKLREPIWVANSGHWIQQEQPDEVNGALLDFFGSLPRWS